jgi:hypothetical protein
LRRLVFTGISASDVHPIGVTMPRSRIIQFDLDHEDGVITIFGVEHDHGGSWKYDDDHEFGTREEAAAWLASAGRELVES